jgi:hypothetical protein
MASTLALKADDSETASRYLIERGHFSPENSRVKPKALEPARKDHKTSVFRISGLADPEIWSFGNEYVARPLGKALLGRGDLIVGEIKALGLAIEVDDNPPRHANIAGWPLEKEKWKSLSQELAAIATLKLMS